MRRLDFAMLGAVMGVLAMLFGGQRASAEKRGELWGQRASLFEMLGTDSTSIVFLGNSLTHGCEWHELFGNPHILNRGINGDVVSGLRERLTSVTAGKPAKIFLLCGVNDISHDLTPDSIVSALGALIADIREQTPSTRLYVQSLLPINNSFGRYKAIFGKEQTVRDVNRLLRPVVERAGATWIDIHGLFADGDGNLRADLTNDGLHLLAPGYAIWRDALRPYVDE
ncbi:MAG: sialate O-acetylesterase [Muribaculaceae bacterium]|nr:sialate O-acetylesterase [Muribaculaceae bacterium]